MKVTLEVAGWRLNVWLGRRTSSPPPPPPDAEPAPAADNGTDPGAATATPQHAGWRDDPRDFGFTPGSPL